MSSVTTFPCSQKAEFGENNFLFTRFPKQIQDVIVKSPSSRAQVVLKTYLNELKNIKTDISSSLIWFNVPKVLQEGQDLPTNAGKKQLVNHCNG